MSNWMEQLRRLPWGQRLVQHEPETPRYGRARAWFDYLTENAHLLGVRKAEVGRNSREVALWAPHPGGSGQGFYACIRLYVHDGEVTLATLFCFYDGTESSPGFLTLFEAIQFARSYGFAEVNSNG